MPTARWRSAMPTCSWSRARSAASRGRSTVSTLRAGTRLMIAVTPLHRLGEEASYTILRVVSVGMNDLPSRAAEALAELFGPIPGLLHKTVRDLPLDLDPSIAQARKAGYPNCFEAVGSDGRAHPRPTAYGAQTAIVVSPDGGDELYCDALGRVRIRYQWQNGGDATSCANYCLEFISCRINLPNGHCKT